MQRERKKVCACALTGKCVCVCMSVCISMTAFRAALLGQLILPHLRSWVRIIKPISRRWLLQPACEWITTQSLPSALQRERTRGEKNETWGKKKEMRKEINKESRQGGGVETERTRQRENIKIFGISHQPSLSKSYLLPPAHTTEIVCWLLITVTTFNLLAPVFS